MKNKELMLVAIGVPSFTLTQMASAMHITYASVCAAVQTAMGYDLIETNGDGDYRVSDVGREEADIMIHDEMKEIIDRVDTGNSSLLSDEDIMRLDFLAIGLMMNEYHKGALILCPSCLKEGKTHFVHINGTLDDIMRDDDAV